MARKRGKRKRYINASKVQLRRQMRGFARDTEPGMLVLDAGAGSAPYRKFFDHAKYEACDFAQLRKEYAPLDYVCDLTDIPVGDERYDRIIFNQVLEHVPDPGKVLAELHRVLKPEGQIFCSVPLFYKEHQQPYDFYRFTRFALRRLFREAGFQISRLEWLEGYFGTVSYQYHLMHRALPKDVKSVRALGAGWRVVYVAPLILLNRRLARRLSKFYARAEITWKYTGGGMPKNYVVVAQKPPAGASG